MLRLTRVRLGENVAQVDILQKRVCVSWSAARNGPGGPLDPGRLRDELQLPVVRATPNCFGNPKGPFLKGLVVCVCRARETKPDASKAGNAIACRRRRRG